jgi:hypothetical protein
MQYCKDRSASPFRARAATRDFQLKHDLPADGFPTEDLLTRIAIEAQTTGR